MKNSFIYNWLPMLFAAMATFSFTACGDGDDTDYAAIAAMQEALNGGANNNTTPEEAGEAIDLGLPSGLKWASCNVGATKPEESGNYYAWGETSIKSIYYPTSYKYYNYIYQKFTKYCTESSYGTVDNKTTLEPDDDVATVKWGDNWRMPTASEIYELLYNCTWKWTSLNETNGYRVTGPNGNSIFLPAAGARLNTETKNKNVYGYIWSSSLSSNYSGDASYLVLINGDKGLYDCNRYYGIPIRPVRK